MEERPVTAIDDENLHVFAQIPIEWIYSMGNEAVKQSRLMESILALVHPPGLACLSR